MATITKEQSEVKEKKKKENEKVLILMNDDFNSFDNVINCLMKYCGHTEEQAHQISLIVHYKGECDVKRGSMAKLTPIKEALQENGLTVRIEE